MITIKVPATSANIGPGFDSLGVALNLYLTLEIHEPTDTWEIIHDYGDSMPSDQNNFIVATALRISPLLKPHRLVVKSDIPLARGLGSSSSALIAALSMVNILDNKHYTQDDLLQIATKLEGHPDNVAPAIFGGAVAAFYDGTTVFHAPLHFPESLSFVTFIPDYQLLTEKARAALPETLEFKQSVAASAISNTLVAALAANSIETARQLIEQDQFHEEARAHLAPELAIIRRIAHQQNIIGTYLSGAGPTIISVVDETEAQQLMTAIDLAQLPGKTYHLHTDFTGSIVQTND